MWPQLQKIGSGSWTNEQGIQLSPITASNTFTAQVVAVKDGDYIIVLRNKEQIDIRLKDVNCLELARPFGRQAKKQTSVLCSGKTVTVEVTGKDNDDRRLAYINLSDGNELGRELVPRGYAWWYRPYANDETLGRLETVPEKRLGLGADSKPIPPWDCGPQNEQNACVAERIRGRSKRCSGCGRSPKSRRQGPRERADYN